MKYKNLQTILNTVFYRGLKLSNASPRSAEDFIAYKPSPVGYRAEIYENRTPDFGNDEQPYSEPYRNELQDEWETQHLSSRHNKGVKNPHHSPLEAETQEPHETLLQSLLQGFPSPDGYLAQDSTGGYDPLVEQMLIESAIAELRVHQESSPEPQEAEVEELTTDEGADDFPDEPTLEQIVEETLEEMQDDPFEQMPDEMYEDIEPEKLLDPFFRPGG